MPFGSVRLIPGVDVEKTPTVNQAGISQSQLVRFRDQLVQKYGGWKKFYGFNIAGVPRELHAWQDLNGAQHLLAGTTSSLNVITGQSLINITPQQFSSNTAVNFSTVANSTTVTVVDTNINNVTNQDTVMINTPVSVGSTIISGVFPIVANISANSYTINLPAGAGTTATNTGSLPLFQTATSSNLVNVNFTSHGLSSTIGGQNVAFQATTTLNGITHLRRLSHHLCRSQQFHHCSSTIGHRGRHFFHECWQR